MSKNDGVVVIKRDVPIPSRLGEREKRYALPATDVYESPEAFVLMIDMPGADRDSLSVTIDWIIFLS